MSKNSHLIQLISKMSLVTPNFLPIKTFLHLQVINRQILKTFCRSNIFTQKIYSRTSLTATSLQRPPLNNGHSFSSGLQSIHLLVPPHNGHLSTTATKLRPEVAVVEKFHGNTFLAFLKTGSIEFFLNLSICYLN